jgi:DNA polymerase III subunit epsilon
MFLFRRRQPLPAFVRHYAAGPWPAPATPWADVPYVVLDVETSGLNRKRDVLLAVGLVEITGGRVQLSSAWQSLIRPPAGHEVAGSSIRIHGLTRAELAAAPPIDAVLPLVLERLRGRALVVHVAQIDVGFLNRALGSQWGGRLHGPILDTARLALTIHHNERLLGSAHIERPALQLAALAQRYGLPAYGQHNPLNDALTTAQVFLAQAHRLSQHGHTTLGGLVRAGGV